jgi:hypothetical protein
MHRQEPDEGPLKIVRKIIDATSKHDRALEETGFGACIDAL